MDYMDDVKVSDLILTDEHDVVDMDDSIATAADKLLSLGRGILIVLGDDKKVKGIVTSNQILAAVSGGGDQRRRIFGRASRIPRAGVTISLGGA